MANDRHLLLLSLESFLELRKHFQSTHSQNVYGCYITDGHMLTNPSLSFSTDKEGDRKKYFKVSCVGHWRGDRLDLGILVRGLGAYLNWAKRKVDIREHSSYEKKKVSVTQIASLAQCLKKSREPKIQLIILSSDDLHIKIKMIILSSFSSLPSVNL